MELFEAGAPVRIRILGVGGAGQNHLDALQPFEDAGIELLAVNTDLRALGRCRVTDKLCVGQETLKGLGAGGQLRLAQAAALKDLEALQACVAGVDVVCLLSGLGGGTGGALAPMLAELAAQNGAFVIAFASLPFPFEGTERHKTAEESLVALRAACDLVVPLPNALLLQQASDQSSILEAFAEGTRWVDSALKALCRLLLRPALINLELSHLKETFKVHGGRTLFGIGSGRGPQAVYEALESLKLCPLLHIPEAAQKADRLLIQCLAGPNITLAELQLLAKDLTKYYQSHQQTLLALAIDEQYGDTLQLCVLGTTVLGQRQTVRRRNWSAQEPTEVSKTPGKPTQAHFEFFENPGRGIFEATSPNWHQEEDLDVPAYLRRGVKITF